MTTVRKRGSRTRPSTRPDMSHRRIIELVVIAMFLGAGWIGLVGSTKPHELLVDIGVVALLTPFAASVLRSDWLTLNFQARDLVQGWRIPWYVLIRCGEITILLLRDLVLGQRTGSHYRACSFRINRQDPVLLARSILAVAYSTMAPNFIVIGIDAEQRQMLFHQVERSSVSRMSQRLGAQSTPES